MLLEQHVFSFILSAALPGIYLASKKDFIYTLNPKCNLFLIRLLFTTPIFIFFNSVISAIIVQSTVWIFPEFTKTIFDTLGHYSASIVPLFFSLVLIYFLKRHLPTDSTIISQTRKKYELYVYFSEEPIPDSRSLGTKYNVINKDREKNELKISSLVGNLIIDGRYMRSEYMGFAQYGGEIVITSEGLKIIEEENLSGFNTRPVKIHEGYKLFSKAENAENRICHQLMCHHLMPNLASPTRINTFKRPLSILVHRSKYYYNQQVLKEVLDFNQTLEFFGSESGGPHFVQRYWVVSKKARDVMVNRLEQRPKDFIPVYLVDDDGNVIDS